MTLKEERRLKRNYILVLFFIAIFLWLFWSWMEVICHNNADCEYSMFNAFVLLDKACKFIHG